MITSSNCGDEGRGVGVVGSEDFAVCDDGGERCDEVEDLISIF